MSEELPDEFDLVVIGTGLSESVVAAAASRIGKTVLHVDENEYYGGFWSSFNIESLLSYLDVCGSATPPQYALQNIEQEWLEFNEEKPDLDGWNKEKILQENRRFNIDLIPKIVYSSGKLVELLISSNICRYTEFRAVDKIVTLQDGKFLIVPCSRADVFTSKNVNVVEKRLLMKFLNNCMEFGKEKKDESEKHDFDGFPEDGKFTDLLQQQKLPKNLVHFVLYAMCMGDEQTSFKDALKSIKLFLSSIGRYGNTPFLFPMYGCGEIPQCFCRLCAVFGGIYCLNRVVSEVERVPGSEKASLKIGDQKITAKCVVRGNQKEATEFLSRGVFLSPTPVGGDSVNSEMDGGGVVFMNIPPTDGSNQTGALMVQLSHYSGTVPKGLYLTHITTPKVQDARTDLQPFVDQLFKKSLDSGDSEDTKPTLLYSLYFNIPCTPDYSVDDQEGPIFSCCGPSFEVDYDQTLEHSEKLFRKIFPDEEYLPKAPDADEILFGDDDGKDVGNINLGVLANIIQEGEGAVETGEIADESTGVLRGGEGDSAEGGENIENATEVKESS